MTNNFDIKEIYYGQFYNGADKLPDLHFWLSLPLWRDCLIDSDYVEITKIDSITGRGSGWKFTGCDILNRVNSLNMK